MGKHTERVVMYLTKEEKREFVRTAKGLKLTTSAYCRLQFGYDHNVKVGAPLKNKNRAGKKGRKRQQKPMFAA